MSGDVSAAAARVGGKRGALFGGALTDEVLDSSPTVLRAGRNGDVIGLQQFYTPPAAAEFIASILGRDQSTLDLTAGDGALLNPVSSRLRFGIEIDGDQIKAGDYEAIHGDVQQAFPLLRMLGARWPRVTCNPPFGLTWAASNGSAENSTLTTWRMALALLADHGAGAFIAGRDRFAREVLSRPDAAGIFALVECDDLFEGTTLPTVIAFFVQPGNVRAGLDKQGPLRLSAPLADLGELVDPVRAERARVADFVVEVRGGRCRYRDVAVGQFATARKELERRRADAAASRSKFDVSLKGARISALPSPFARVVLQDCGRLRQVQRLDRQPPTYFAQNFREWRQLCELADDDVLTIDPALREAVKDATAEAERAVCPLYPVRPQQRLAFLDDLDSIRCTTSDDERGFEAGERYPLTTSSDLKVTRSERPFQKRSGEVEVRRYECEAKVLRITIGDGQVFTEAAADVAYLLDHFEIPDPGDLATRFPEAVGEARDLLARIADEQGFEFKRSDTEDWQIEDLARLVAKGSGVLCWEQGGGKSLGGATLIRAQWERGAARKGLIVCPQDLIPQWRREIEKFYGAAVEHITSPAQARAVARHLDAGGEGLYITHYEMLSLIGRVDEPLPVTPLRLPFAERDQHGELLPTSDEFCPECHADPFVGWQQDSPYVCSRCGYVHKRLKVKTAGHYLAHPFADGVIVIDEGTLAKGDDSLRSKAIRGLRARHRYLLTGTPVSNYVNDVFWLMWWALGNATLRFPYAYEGGRAKFEADFCVIEHDVSKGKRERRKVLPQVTNVSRLWRLLAGAMVRRRKQDMGELVPRTISTIAAPMGKAQLDLYRYWLSTANFERYFAWKHPGHAMLEAGLVGKFAAGLGQLTKLEYATTLPESDPDRAWDGVAGLTHSNWTPKNLKVLQVALEHVQRGEKVLIGSDLIETGRWLCDRLKEKGVRAAHIVEERNGRAATMNPRRRAAAIEAFKHGETQVLCCGIPSIRLGHSLETASCVITTGLVFSYEMFDQFIARAWRLTSPKPVSVYIALTLGSLDEKKWQLLCQKAQAADLALDGQLIDEPEQPISREQVLRDLRKQGVKATGDELAEGDIQAAWEATTAIQLVAPVSPPTSGPVEPIQPLKSFEQLDLFAA